MNFDTLRHVRYVQATIECGSMRQAARMLGVQESTVSRHIGSIEQQLDIRFFERRSNGVVLTMAGKHWLDSVKEHLDGLEEAVLQTARRNRGSMVLQIGLCAPVGLEFLLRLVDRFEAIHPDVEVMFHDGSCTNQAAAIRRRDLDVSFMCSCADMHSCRNETIWEEGLAVLLPSSHELAAQETLTWENLAGERLLVPMGPDGPQFDPCFLDRITRNPQAPIVEQCQASQTTVMIKVRLGKGFTLAGESLADATAVDGTVWRPVVGDQSRCEVRAVWLDSNPKNTVLRLVGIAQKLAAERVRT